MCTQGAVEEFEPIPELLEEGKVRRRQRERHMSQFPSWSHDAAWGHAHARPAAVEDLNPIVSCLEEGRSSTFREGPVANHYHYASGIKLRSPAQERGQMLVGDNECARTNWQQAWRGWMPCNALTRRHTDLSMLVEPHAGNAAGRDSQLHQTKHAAGRDSQLYQYPMLYPMLYQMLYENRLSRCRWTSCRPRRWTGRRWRQKRRGWTRSGQPRARSPPLWTARSAPSSCSSRAATRPTAATCTTSGWAALPLTLMPNKSC